jgi:dihydrofolate synthase/folylpolyglutamate synthase
VDYERRAPNPSDLKLDRMRELLRRLGDPHHEIKSVHVAGSKGKGSTCAMLESVLRHAKYRTGLFTSPHLSDVRERIQVNRELISEDDLVAVAKIVKPVVEALEAAGQPPTFFEVTTALGFLHFARQRVQIAVVEVGLGGRFDSTNVLTPLVSIITSISLDHTAILGETLEKIAFEKAGIIKPGVPVVSGVTEAGPREVIEKVAAERGARLIQLGVDFRFGWDRQTAFLLERVEVQTANQKVTFQPTLHGRHQAANAAIAVAALDVLIDDQFAIHRTNIEQGMLRVDWPARFEMVPTQPTAVIDCAHNVASAEALDSTMLEWFPKLSRSLIFGSSSDKDVAGMFRVLAPHFERFYLTRSDSPRAIPPEKLAEALPAGTQFACFEKPLDAWEAARSDTPKDGLIVIAGSVFLAGELRPHLLAAVSPADER